MHLLTLFHDTYLDRGPSYHISIFWLLQSRNKCSFTVYLSLRRNSSYCAETWFSLIFPPSHWGLGKLYQWRSDIVSLCIVLGFLPMQESLCVVHISHLIHPQHQCICACLCFVRAEQETAYVLWESNEQREQYQNCKDISAVFRVDKAVFSPTTTTAAIPTLAHLSQRAYEEDSWPTHICFRSKAICCKCVCDGRK